MGYGRCCTHCGHFHHDELDVCEACNSNMARTWLMLCRIRYEYDARGGRLQIVEFIDEARNRTYEPLPFHNHASLDTAANGFMYWTQISDEFPNYPGQDKVWCIRRM